MLPRSHIESNPCEWIIAWSDSGVIPDVVRSLPVIAADASPKYADTGQLEKIEKSKELYAEKEGIAAIVRRIFVTETISLWSRLSGCRQAHRSRSIDYRFPIRYEIVVTIRNMLKSPHRLRSGRVMLSPLATKGVNHVSFSDSDFLRNVFSRTTTA